MPPPLLLRRGVTWWVSLPLLFLCLLYARNVLPATREFYPLSITNAGAWTLAIIAPVSAAWAAWEGGQLYRADWFDLPHARSSTIIVLVHLVPIVITGTTTLLVAVLYKFVEVGRFGMPDLRVLGLAIAVIFAQSLLGFAVGVCCTPVIAVPTVFLAAWCWMALTPAISILWIRHLTGSLSGCCSLATDVPPKAVLGSLLMAVGFVLSSITLLHSSWKKARFVLAVLPTVLAFSAGALVVHGMGPNAVAPRSASTLVCQPGTPTVCVWPEHQSRLHDVALIASGAAQAWGNAGVPLPSKFTEQQSPGKTGSFLIAASATRDDVILDLTTVVIPPFPTCAESGPWPGGRSENVVRAWLGEVAGVSEASLDRQFSPRDLDIASGVRTLPIARQQAWIRQNLEALQSCTVQPLLGSYP